MLVMPQEPASSVSAHPRTRERSSSIVGRCQEPGPSSPRSRVRQYSAASSQSYSGAARASCQYRPLKGSSIPPLSQSSLHEAEFVDEANNNVYAQCRSVKGRSVWNRRPFWRWLGATRGEGAWPPSAEAGAATDCIRPRRAVPDNGAIMSEPTRRSQSTGAMASQPARERWGGRVIAKSLAVRD